MLRISLNNHCDQLMANFIEDYVKGEGYDCILICEGRDVKCHKYVLKSFSNYFRRTFDNQLVSDYLSKWLPPCILLLINLNYSTLKSLIDFMYFGRLDLRGKEIQLVLEAARNFGINNLDYTLESLDVDSENLEDNENLSTDQETTTLIRNLTSKLQNPILDDLAAINMAFAPISQSRRSSGADSNLRRNNLSYSTNSTLTAFPNNKLPPPSPRRSVGINNNSPSCLDDCDYDSSKDSRQANGNKQFIKERSPVEPDLCDKQAKPTRSFSNQEFSEESKSMYQDELISCSLPETLRDNEKYAGRSARSSERKDNGNDDDADEYASVSARHSKNSSKILQDEYLSGLNDISNRSINSSTTNSFQTASSSLTNCSDTNGSLEFKRLDTNEPDNHFLTKKFNSKASSTKPSKLNMKKQKATNSGSHEREPPPSFVPLEEIIEISFAQFTHPSDFYLHLDVDQVNKLVDVMQIEQSRLAAAKTKLKPCDIRIGKLVAAKYNHNRCYYRAKIIKLYNDSFDEDGDVEVIYIDYGHTERISIADLLPLVPSLLDYNIQAVHCCLANVPSMLTSWSESSIDLLKNNPLLAFKACFYAPFMDDNVNDMLYPVEIFVHTTKDSSFYPLLEYLSLEDTVERHSDIEGSTQLLPSRQTSQDYSDNDYNGEGEEEGRISDNEDHDANAMPESRNSVSRIYESSSAKSRCQLYQIPPPQLPIAEYHLCVVSALVDPSEFYIHLSNDDSSQLDDIQEQLSNHFNNTNPDGSSNNNLSFDLPLDLNNLIDSCWAALFPLDNEWYRVKVIGLLDGEDEPIDDVQSQRILVQYIDYGNKEALTVGELRPLSPDLVNIPAFAVYCSLSHISPPSEGWSDDCLRYFESLSGMENEQTVTVYVTDRPNKSNFEQPLSVFLWNSDSALSQGKDILVNAALVKSGHALTDSMDWVIEAEAQTREKTPPEVALARITAVATRNSGNAALLDLPIKLDKIEEELPVDWDPMKEDHQDPTNSYAYDPNDPGTILTGYKGRDHRDICSRFAVGYCKFGDTCVYKHVKLDQGNELDVEKVMIEPFESQWLEENMMIELTVTYVESPFSFYCIPLDGQKIEQPERSRVGINCDFIEPIMKNYIAMNEEMREFYKKPQNKENYLIWPAISSLVAIDDDSGFYRARVIDMSIDEDTCLVINIDTGAQFEVDRSKIYSLKPEFAILPSYAVHCCIADIEPLSEDYRWSFEISKRFSDLVLGKSFTAHLKERDLEGRFKIELYGKDDQLTVSQRLIQLNYARHVNYFQRTKPEEKSKETGMN